MKDKIIEILKSKQKTIECLSSGIYMKAVDELDFEIVAYRIIDLFNSKNIVNNESEVCFFSKKCRLYESGDCVPKACADYSSKLSKCMDIEAFIRAFDLLEKRLNQ